MKRMKTFGSIIIVLIIFLSVITGGCQRRYSQDMVMMFTQVFHAVPGERSFDPNVIKGEIIETDEYGRMRFSFWTGIVEGVCIMQKHDEKYVYYYDNVSYLVSEQYKEHTTEELDFFLEANDWNQPLDESKMTKRELIDNYSLKPNRESINDYERAKRAFYETNDEMDCVTSAGIIDYSQNGQELFIVTRHEAIKNETGGNEYALIDQYFMILNADGGYDPENYLLKIDDLTQSNEPLAEIKARNGWVG